MSDPALHVLRELGEISTKLEHHGEKLENIEALITVAVTRIADLERDRTRVVAWTAGAFAALGVLWRITA